KPPMEDWRGNNILMVVPEVNALLEARGDNRRVQAVVVQDNMEWGDMIMEFVLATDAGEAPDIWHTGHEFIGAQAEAGRIIPLDELIGDNPEFDNVIDNLWDSVKYKGKIWGIPQDAEARPLYWNKPLLKKLGWTDREIEALPEKIRKGEFTLYDMLETAKEAVDRGIVPPGKGFWHRPKNGPDFTAIYYAFGGETIDPATGKMVFDRDAFKKYYQFFWDASQTYRVTEVLGVSWDTWHSNVSGGRVLFFLGGNWQWAEWAEVWVKDLGGEAHLFENFGFGLIPAAEKGGRPNTLSHPTAYLISSQPKHPDIALALIAKITTDEANTRHAINSTHLGVLKSQAQYEPYKKSRLLSETLYMLEYTTYLPNNPNWGPYSTITYEALAAVEAGQLTPEEALAFAEEGLKRELGDKVIIR
ncbi:MAG TPA: extracellular solute-binding protein, partial [bacterium]|nr:extracellular solute-binding protein [bacterium]